MFLRIPKHFSFSEAKYLPPKLRLITGYCKKKKKERKKGGVVMCNALLLVQPRDYLLI